VEPLVKLKPDFYKEINDPSVDLKGFVVIDKQINGCATGGIRMAEEVTLEEVANLAHEMTLKYGFLNIKKDGAKAGIVAPPGITQQKKKVICMAFGKAIQNLLKDNKYSPGEDLGINAQDLTDMLSGAGIYYAPDGHEINSAYFTALTVYLSVKELLQSQGSMIEGTSIIIEGFGKVGSYAARMFLRTKTRIIGISTQYGALFDEHGLAIEEIFRLKEQHGDSFIHFYRQDKRIKKEDLLLQRSDILIPGARPDCINPENVRALQAKNIVPIANIPATEEMEQELFKKILRIFRDLSLIAGVCWAIS
jgi:glutamate dehydrogenase/leucine dehydrogenase